LVLIPGFVQWDTTRLENKLATKIRKGPEFASDIPAIIQNLSDITLSHTVPANKLLEKSGKDEYEKIVNAQKEHAKNNLGTHTFYINKKKSDLLIGRNLPPPIIAEIVNCTEKEDLNIIKKAQHYLDSGADIIDIGCVSNKPNVEKVRHIINLLRKNFDLLLSIDSMDIKEIFAAVDEGIDMILSFDLGNYKKLLQIPKDIPIVILPTNLNKAYFPKEPQLRVENLFKLTTELQRNGFNKLIADPLLETPISPGINNSLQTYFLYNSKIKQEKYKDMELPLFFGISNVVELIDIDSIGINGLLASIAIELDMGVLFTVEHSIKLMKGVAELKDAVRLNYLSKFKKTPPINQGISVFRAKGKTNGNSPIIDELSAIYVNQKTMDYIPDQNGYFKIYVNHYKNKIYIQHLSNDHELLNTFIGTDAEALSKEIIKLNITNNLQHINYLGRELFKAEFCLFSGKPYVQDE
jgi:dihydropteroate synthase-like protein